MRDARPKFQYANTKITADITTAKYNLIFFDILKKTKNPKITDKKKTQM